MPNTVAVDPQQVDITVKTPEPEKWLLIDMENGRIFQGQRDPNREGAGLWVKWPGFPQFQKKKE